MNSENAETQRRRDRGTARSLLIALTHSRVLAILGVLHVWACGLCYDAGWLGCAWASGIVAGLLLISGMITRAGSLDET